MNSGVFFFWGGGGWIWRLFKDANWLDIWLFANTKYVVCSK